MSAVTITAGGLAVQDPSDVRVYVFDWDADNLDTGVLISNSTFTITAIRPSGDTALVKDNEAIQTGSRKTQLRLSVGTLGAVYQIANKIVTNEAVPQTKDQSFRLLIQNR
jgi:hypothetical protein